MKFRLAAVASGVLALACPGCADSTYRNACAHPKTTFHGEADFVVEELPESFDTGASTFRIVIRSVGPEVLCVGGVEVLPAGTPAAVNWGRTGMSHVPAGVAHALEFDSNFTDLGPVAFEVELFTNAQSGAFITLPVEGVVE